jgi:membrane protein DedA with SNARE-associated domain
VSAQLTHYITEFGYVAIFLLVFLQEIGVPNPVTNEFVLLFSGYLAYCGVLQFWPVFLTAVSADCIGTALLYAVFYRFGKSIVRRRPRWIPVSPERLEQVASRISTRQHWSIYLARLVPFLRGYASVAAGMLSIPPRVFFPAVVFSAITWSGGYVAAGLLLGPYWEEAASRVGTVEVAALIAVLLVAATLIGRALLSRRRQAV